jgi:hypothetical protein
VLNSNLATKRSYFTNISPIYLQPAEIWPDEVTGFWYQVKGDSDWPLIDVPPEKWSSERVRFPAESRSAEEGFADEEDPIHGRTDCLCLAEG